MPGFAPGALVAYGCNDRVLALLASAVADDPAPLPPADPAARSHPATPDPPAPELARVTRVERSACFAVAADGEQRPLRARPLPAVGDWIRADRDAVRDVLPRWSAITRLDPNGDAVQTLAANVDLVAITAPADRCSPARVEREVAIAWDSGAIPLVLVTKADLDVDGVADQLAARLASVDVIAVSAATGAGVDALRARLAPDRTLALLGPSGAGKSTLANALLGDERLATGAVRAGDGRGRHTTTSRQLIAVPGGGALIDTPGLRSLGLAGDVAVGDAFPDVEELARSCRFADCRHDGEPDCAVSAALQAGELDPERLRSFHKLQRETEALRRRVDPLAARDQRRLHGSRVRDARAGDKRRPR